MDPAFHFNADLVAAPSQSEVILRRLVYRLYKAPILSLHASIISVHGPSRLYFKLLEFYLHAFHSNADPDPDPDSAFHSNADPDQTPKNNADPDPQPRTT
jgi:hypothetical protein